MRFHEAEPDAQVMEELKSALRNLGCSNAQKAEFKVHDTCGMYESRIEKTAKSVDGVASADWNRETKILNIEYVTKKTSLNDVQKNITKAGHDTDKARAKDDVYKALFACCHYDRPAGDKTGQ